MPLFIPITKVDAKRRLVYGTLSEEIADKSGEILDYESSKPAFQKWSDEQFEASGGKSKGNLRAMHDNIAAGKFTEINFDDDAKKIEGCAKVIDDDSWNKVLEGVFTGFSIGGGYSKRWTDPNNPSLKRYTPELAEVSLVDNPCVPTATFEFIKEDGSTELRKFNHQEVSMTDQTTTTTEQPADVIAERPQDKGGVVQGFMAKDGSFHVKKADALSRNEQVEAETIAAPAVEALKKLDEAVTKAEAKDDQIVPPTSTKSPSPVDKAAPSDEVKKGMYGISNFACLLSSIDSLQEDSKWESIFEGDSSEMPGKLKEWLKAGGELLRQMVAEETAELAGDEDDDVMEMANAIKGLAKKGAKISAATKEVIDEMHKSAHDHVTLVDKCYKALGMDTDSKDGDETDPDNKTEKSVALERDALKKVLGDLTPQIEALTKRIETQQAEMDAQKAEIKLLADQPMPPKGVLRAVSKSEDGGNVSDGDTVKKAEALMKGMNPDQINMLLMKSALAHPQPGHP